MPIYIMYSAGENFSQMLSFPLQVGSYNSVSAYSNAERLYAVVVGPSVCVHKMLRYNQSSKIH
jgi:hypothetical protein